jgi:hypothetical protein
MLVKINNSNDNEWCILELQGEVIGELDDNVLGTITINNNTAIMTIGQLILEGSVTTLKSPFIVIEKKNNKNKNDSNNTDNMIIDDDSSSTIDIEGYAYKKIIFNSRPRPNTKGSNSSGTSSSST